MLVHTSPVFVIYLETNKSISKPEIHTFVSLKVVVCGIYIFATYTTII